MLCPAEGQVSPVVVVEAWYDSLRRPLIESLAGSVLHICAGGADPLEPFRFARVCGIVKCSPELPSYRCPRCDGNAHYRVTVEWESGYESPNGNEVCESCIHGIVVEGRDLIPFGNQIPRPSSLEISVRYDSSKRRIKKVINSSTNCLRCSNVALAPLPMVSHEINFYECPSCYRHYAQKPGRSLTFRWLHPISLVLYGFSNRLQKDGDYAPHVAREIAKGRSAEQVESFRREIELELEQPSQPVREILDTEASEEACREFLSLVVGLLGSPGQTETEDE